MKAGDEIFTPVLRPPNRRPKLAREPGDDHEFGRQRHLLPEPAADIGGDHAQIRFRHADQFGDDRPHGVRHLGRAVERQALAARIPRRMRGARLQRQGILPVRSNVDPDTSVRRGRGRVERGGLHPSFDDDIAGRLGMDRRSAGRQRRTRIDDGRHRFDLDLDKIGDVLGLLPRRRDHRRDRLADEAHDILRQHRLADRHVVELVQHRLDRLHRREVGSRNDRRAGRCGNPHDPAGGQRAPDKADPARRRQVAGEPALAGHQGWVLDPPHRAADPAAISFRMDGHRHQSA